MGAEGEAGLGISRELRLLAKIFSFFIVITVAEKHKENRIFEKFFMVHHSVVDVLKCDQESLKTDSK